MQVILIQDVKSVGKKGQLVEVSEGYGTNFLLPKKLAMIATKSNMNELKLKEESEAHKKEVELLQAQQLGEKLTATTVEIKAKLGENGKLFGSITNKEIALELEKQYAIKIDKKKIVLEDPIKTLGTHEVVVKLHAKVAVKLNVKISELR
jgi:large subunit ribosomal protein L9